MQPSHPSLSTLLGSLIANGEPSARAIAENYRYEERVAPDRQQAYEEGLPTALADIAPWFKGHTDYLNKEVWQEHPETFRAANGAAALPAAVLSELGGEQTLLRIENLDYALKAGLAPDWAAVEQALAVYRRERTGEDTKQEDAKVLLEKVCGYLSHNDFAKRPRFAAFEQDMAEDVDAPDWAERLRERLGLAHLQAGTAVALMRYKVKEVVKAAERLGAPHALTVPTVLDGRFSDAFHPAPVGLPCGRTLNLAGNPDCDRLAAEVLHLHIDYSPTHMVKVGVLTARADTSPARIAELRAEHLFCLRYWSNRNDFGSL